MLHGTGFISMIISSSDFDLFSFLVNINSSEMSWTLFQFRSREHNSVSLIPARIQQEILLKANYGSNTSALVIHNLKLFIEIKENKNNIFSFYYSVASENNNIGKYVKRELANYIKAHRLLLSQVS